MASELQFDPGKHQYTKDGIIVPNVTLILQEIVDYSMVPEAKLEYASQLGTAAHLATELYDRDDLDEESVAEPVRPLLNAWIRFRQETGFISDTMEEKVFHPKEWYAGTLDRTGSFNDSLAGRLLRIGLGLPASLETVLLDIKTTSRLMPSTGPQLAAYMEAKNYRKSDKIRRRYAVQLRKDGTYRLEEYKDPADFSVFKSCLQLYNWRLKYGQ